MEVRVDEQVTEIKRRRLDGEPLARLAEEFNVSISMVSAIALEKKRVAPKAGLSGPSREIKVEPLREAPAQPEPRREPEKAPAREPEKAPAKV